MKDVLKHKLLEVQTKSNYSGTIVVNDNNGMNIELSSGYANRSDELDNRQNTRYGIASGCKLFTAVAICQLVQSGKLSFEAKLKDTINTVFPLWDDSITIHHLLTHISGIPDYFDEEVMDDFEALWKETPMYTLRHLADFLPLFQNKPMKMKPGERFHYNNAGYILLGLVVEKVSGKQFTDYVEEHIFQRAGMLDSGYFSFDALPARTAIGYMVEVNGSWRTNLYSLPIRGGSDGGAFITAPDMSKCWQALLHHELLNETLTKKLLTPFMHEEGSTYYGYGIWIEKDLEGIIKYHVMGYDPGVNFHSAYYPKNETTFVACSNVSSGAYKVMKVFEEVIHI
ncbi:serine hydrolase domain-containing protein [Oceanobacillus polygoni]|uniref:CubicO group peptidase (Beta-lactamase class C family) n=1 Tax=Oceanobacillus polygoni TaxID=1235259 RepID=A0A9X1CG04_9BACI|nr:serine hydrolase [Oceanobacillus polygoni]MBP2078010.1 CubicO group peptidase (beta-lactamase class C family) [Oceanobacillus polygoni]